MFHRLRRTWCERLRTNQGATELALCPRYRNPPCSPTYPRLDLWGFGVFPLGTSRHPGRVLKRCARTHMPPARQAKTHAPMRRVFDQSRMHRLLGVAAALDARKKVTHSAGHSAISTSTPPAVAAHLSPVASHHPDGASDRARSETHRTTLQHTTPHPCERSDLGAARPSVGVRRQQPRAGNAAPAVGCGASRGSSRCPSEPHLL